MKLWENNKANACNRNLVFLETSLGLCQVGPGCEPFPWKNTDAVKWKLNPVDSESKTLNLKINSISF